MTSKFVFYLVVKSGVFVWYIAMLVFLLPKMVGKISGKMSTHILLNTYMAPTINLKLVNSC